MVPVAAEVPREEKRERTFRATVTIVLPVPCIAAVLAKLSDPAKQ